MAIEIRETIVTPDASGDVVQLRISDAPLGDESVSFQLTILAKVSAYEAPALAQLQRKAMQMARDAMTPLFQGLADKLKKANQPLDPSPRHVETRYEDENWQAPDDN